MLVLLGKYGKINYVCYSNWVHYVQRKDNVEMAEKTEQKIKVLQVLGSTGLGGAESRIMDLYKKIDREKVTFDFLVHMDAKLYKKAIREGKDATFYRTPEYYDAQIKELGGQIYALPRFRVYNILSYKKAVRRFFLEHQDIDVVHGHMTSTAAIYLPIAKKCGVKATVAHARSAGVDAGIKGKITGYLRKDLWKKADYLFACSKLAADAVFNFHEARFVPNAIDTEKFVFDDDIRRTIREEIGISENTLLCGHVGRFHYAKNHEYLLHIFAKLVEKNPDSKLLLLGEGPGMEAQKLLATQLKIQDKVLFLGNKSNPQAYYHAMDIFVFPSRYEGLPGTVIEAQASGLPCLISDAIAKETAATDLVHWESIEKDPSVWAEEIMTLIKAGNNNRSEGVRKIKEAGFDSLMQAENMQKFYFEAVNGKV